MKPIKLTDLFKYKRTFVAQKIKLCNNSVARNYYAVGLA